MQRADKALTDALDAGERTVTNVTRLGGEDVSQQVQSWQVERAYSTDLPAAMRAFSGSAAAQLTLDVAGDGDLSAPQLYSPWAPRSTGDIARPGQSVVHMAGVGPSALPAFRGTVRSRSAASGTDTVQITALDGAERLRGPGTLPRPNGMYLDTPVATATWCVDELLRQGGIHSCPPPRGTELSYDKPQTVFYASLHGGFAATYGQPNWYPIPSPGSYTWERDRAPHEMALLPKWPDLSMTWAPRSGVPLLGSRLLAEVWVNNSIGPGDKVELQLSFNRGSGTGLFRIVVDFNVGDVWIYAGSDSSTTSFRWPQWQPQLSALKGVWHLGLYIEVPAGSDPALPYVRPLLTMPDGDTLVGYGAFTNTVAQQTASELSAVTLITDMATECVQVSSGLAGSPTIADFTQSGQWIPGARLDEAIFPLRAVPKVSGSQWEGISQIAKACMATVEFDEHGIFRWHNYTRFATTPSAPDLTLTSVRDISSLTVTEEIDACRNYCVQPYQDWTNSIWVSGAVYTDTEIRAIPRYSSIEVTYPLAEENFDLDPPKVVTYEAPAYESAVRVSVDPKGASAAVKGALEVGVRREGGSVVLRFVNRTNSTLYTATSDGKPSMQLSSTKPSQEPVERRTAAWNTGSQKYYGLQEYTADLSDWVQDKKSATALATAMLDAGRNPVPVIGDVEVLYNPRVQLGDVVRLVDTAGAKLETLAWVIGIKTSAVADGQVQQTLTLRGTAHNGPPMDWLVPDPPVEPGYGQEATYAEVARAYTTLGDLVAAHATWQDVRSGT